MQRLIREDLLLMAQIESVMAQIDELDSGEAAFQDATDASKRLFDQRSEPQFRPRPSNDSPQPPYEPPASHGEGGDRGDPAST